MAQQPAEPPASLPPGGPPTPLPALPACCGGAPPGFTADEKPSPPSRCGSPILSQPLSIVLSGSTTGPRWMSAHDATRQQPTGSGVRGDGPASSTAAGERDDKRGNEGPIIGPKQSRSEDITERGRVESPVTLWGAASGNARRISTYHARFRWEAGGRWGCRRAPRSWGLTPAELRLELNPPLPVPTHQPRDIVEIYSAAGIQSMSLRHRATERACLVPRHAQRKAHLHDILL